MLWKDVWWGESPAARWTRGALTPASWLYAAGWRGYLALYRFGLKHPDEPHRPVICVGNLVAGGSGKSPLVIALVRYLRASGRTVVVGCSGFGSPASEAARLAPEGPLGAKEWGDEAAMFRWLVPDLPLIVGRRRVLAAQICTDSFPEAVLVMDDGFQHLPLRKQLTLVLDDQSPINSQCLPAGPYREPRSQRSRADLVLPGRFRVDSHISELRSPEGVAVAVPPGTAVRPLCALGQPDLFLASLREMGLSATGPILRPDHDPLDAGNLFDGTRSDDTVVATAKDWVKLRSRADLNGRKLLVAVQETRVQPESEFVAWIDQKLNEIASQTTRT